uniref:Ciliary associated calcium binding coiled-coil 1 n=1 Tax=Sphenodon punctatus TaxID=8508 RepID=A0A8D0GRW5_SPHPU
FLAESVLQLEEFLDFKLYKTSLKEAVLLDYYVSGFWWAKEMGFSQIELSGFMTLLNLLLENLNTEHMTLQDNIKELGRTMAGVGQPHSEKSSGLNFFNIDQAKAIISYLKSSLFQHYKLYEYLFHSPREELVIGNEVKLEKLQKKGTKDDRAIEQFTCKERLKGLGHVIFF